MPQKQEMRWLDEEPVFPLSITPKTTTKSFSIAAAIPNMVATTAKVKDIARNLEYTVNLADMSWSPGKPSVRPGSGNLYVWFQAKNLGSDGSVTFKIKDDTGAVLKSSTVSVAFLSYGSVEWTGTMPSREYGITIEVTP